MKDSRQRRDSDPAFHLALDIAADAAEGRYTYPEHLHPDTSVVEMWGHEFAKAIVAGDDDFFRRVAKWCAYLKLEGKLDELRLVDGSLRTFLPPSERTLTECATSSYSFLENVLLKRPPTKREWRESTFRSWTNSWKGSVCDALEEHRRQLDRVARDLGLKFAPERLSRTSSKRSMS